MPRQCRSNPGRLGLHEAFGGGPWRIVAPCATLLSDADPPVLERSGTHWIAQEGPTVGCETPGPSGKPRAAPRVVFTPLQCCDRCGAIGASIPGPRPLRGTGPFSPSTMGLESHWLRGRTCSYFFCGGLITEANPTCVKKGGRGWRELPRQDSLSASNPDLTFGQLESSTLAQEGRKCAIKHILEFAEPVPGGELASGGWIQAPTSRLHRPRKAGTKGWRV